MGNESTDTEVKSKIISEWKAPIVERTEIGEMEGRPKTEKTTIREYVAWFLGEKVPEIILALNDPGDTPLPIGADPSIRVEANRENERREWEERFKSYYPEVTAEDVAKTDFRDIICLPALGNTSANWQGEVSFLNSKLEGKAKVMVIETPEVGETIEGTDKTYTLESLSEFVSAKIKEMEEKKELRPGEKTFVGHSKGGLIAVYIAGDHPEMVANLICISTPFKPEGLPPAGWMFPLLNNLRYIPLDEVLNFAESAFGIKKEKINGMFRKASVAHCIDTYLEILRTKWDQVLAEMPKDIGFVATKGREDGALDAGRYQASKGVTNGTTIGFPDTGHEKPPVDYLFRIIVGEAKKLAPVGLPT
jgi:pimeloyl-ACP methyl ester carboxylesterase